MNKKKLYCTHCGNEWEYSTRKGGPIKKRYVSCPKCAYKVRVDQYRRCPYCSSVFAETYNNGADDPQDFRWVCPGCKKKFPLAHRLTQDELEILEKYGEGYEPY